jgi:hypothetical protein
MGINERQETVNQIPSASSKVARSPSAVPNAPEGEPPKVGTPSRGTQGHPKYTLYLAVGVIIVVAMFLTAYVLISDEHPKASSSGIVLVPAGTGYSLPIGQWTGTSFTANSASVITGTLNSSRGVAIYLMTTEEFATYARTLNISGYAWASGLVADQSTYPLNIPVPAGTWYIAFTDPNVNFPTGIGIYTDITLKPV